MKRRSRIGGWFGGLGLLLSVGSAIPSLQWCALPWQEVPMRCLLGDASTCPAAAEPRAGTCSDRAGCSLRTKSTHASGSAQSTPARTPSDRAWCLSPGAPRVTPRADVDHSLTPLGIAPKPAPVLAPIRWFHGTWIAEARPPNPPGHAPPSTRAPPTI